MNASPSFGNSTDYYELTMAQSYLKRGMVGRATFSCFARRMPPNRGFLLASGIERILASLEAWRFTAEDVALLESKGFTPDFLDWLSRIRFEGEVRAVSEGTVLYPEEPFLEITATLPLAQLLETFVMNEIGFPTLVATKAARCLMAARGRACVDFSCRRTHSFDAAVKAARSMYIAGFAATSNVLAAEVLDIPTSGTMAHSYVTAFDSELAAFRAFAEDCVSDTVLLVDTYDTINGIRNAITVGRELTARGQTLRGIRLDSGDVIELSRRARTLLDEAGLPDVRIFASGGMDELAISRIAGAEAPVDAFGVGAAVGAVDDGPVLDVVYKMVDYNGQPTTKLSPGKRTWAGPKQVFRQGQTDLLTLADRNAPGTPLLTTLWRGRARTTKPESLLSIRARATDELSRVPAERKKLTAPQSYSPTIDEALQRIQDQAEIHLRQASEGSSAV